jgi:hypothetical protein
MQAYRYTVGLRSILLAIAGEGESERYLLIQEKEREMGKRVKATCVECATHEGLFITLGNGERLPSYHLVIGKGIVCNSCSDKSKVSV